MGAGQVGGIATLLDIDFENAAGFAGSKADLSEAHFIVYFLSHSMLFCTGALIEAHVVLTVASCVQGERYKFDVFGGTHTFLERSGVSREVVHYCIHTGYNHTSRWTNCSPDNLALLVLSKQYFFHAREPFTEFAVNRLRYGNLATKVDEEADRKRQCVFYGWGSRRNNFLVPLLITLRRVETRIQSLGHCWEMWNYKYKFLCLSSPACRSDKHGALCPDDLGSVLVCDGYLRGIMISLLIDRPCGIGFLDLHNYNKFLICGIDDARDVLFHSDDYRTLDITTNEPPTPSVIHVHAEELTTDPADEITIDNLMEEGAVLAAEENADAAPNKVDTVKNPIDAIPNPVDHVALDGPVQEGTL